jgi:ATP-dependent DNA helicase PIF1
VKLILWDEELMQHQLMVEAVNKCLRDVTKNISVFGGIQEFFAGNWAHMLPVVPEGTRANIVNACLHQFYI